MPFAVSSYLSLCTTCSAFVCAVYCLAPKDCCCFNSMLSFDFIESWLWTHSREKGVMIHEKILSCYILHSFIASALFLFQLQKL